MSESNSSNEKTYRALALIDRDGCLIEERHYLSDPDQVVLIPEAVEAIRLLADQDVACVLCTNQSGVARGMFTEADVERVHDRLIELLKNEGVALQGIYSATHHPEATVDGYDQHLQDRKPNTGMADQAKQNLRLAEVPCFAIGDKLIDVEFGKNAGGFGVLVKTGHGADEFENHGETIELVSDHLLEAAQLALNELIKREYPDDEMLREKLRTPAELRLLCDTMKAEGKRVGFANGCFDLLHGGHISFLENSRAAGDCLILGLNSNTSIKRLKGSERPILDEAARIQLLSALRAVDYLTVFYEDSADETLRTILPTYHAKGTDYQHDNVPELVTTRSLGIETVIAGAPKENSTRDIIDVIGERTKSGIL